jgi:D-amino-acid dehydrogenase
MSSYDAMVVGGGVVGMSTAYHLVCDGARTLLIDRQDVGRATDAGAGILSADTYGGDSEAWFNFGVEASAYYPHLIERLQSEQDGETGYSRCGKLTVAVSADEIGPFEQTRDRIFARQQRRGLPANEDLYELSPGEARRLFPPLAQVHRALYYRKAARVDGRLLTGALQRAAEQRGLTVERASVDQLLLSGNAVAGVIANGKTFEADRVAIAGGAWSRALGDLLDVQIPVEPQRGQIIHLDLPGMDTANWPIVNAFRDHYLVPWSDNRVVAGATRESGAGFNAHTTAAGVHETLSEALRVAPGLGPAQIREIRIGLRPSSADLLPVLGAVPHWENIFLATGHGASGLQLGPFSGKIIAELMLDRLPQTDITAFHITRFAN